LLRTGDAGCSGQIQVSDMAEGRMGCQAVVMRLPAPGKSFTQSILRKDVMDSLESMKAVWI